ncbi:hypothetical protein AALO_G00194380 [Alosa alosa]|uniref:Uncharacterized protein n=1 Tax=Alosa alosa TaxID=278164 RepID=A0AAV6G647_9TELE|nr:hypothetical protein AALO_G00194380 [Alosa alosa]
MHLQLTASCTNSAVIISKWAPSTDQGKVETETLTNKLISIINIDGDGGKGAFIRCHPASPSLEPEAGTARWGRIYVRHQKGGLSKKERASADSVAIRHLTFTAKGTIRAPLPTIYTRRVMDKGPKCFKGVALPDHGLFKPLWSNRSLCSHSRQVIERGRVSLRKPPTAGEKAMLI